ncbi:MAG TPA: helix-turn-helix domain-containing protein [Chitinophaga sp.]
MKRSAIALHKDELKAGVEISPLEDLGDLAGVLHRDDHFMFIIQQKGSFLLELDFTEERLSGSSLCYIAPGQVHRYIQQRNCKGWFVFMETAFISNSYLEIFNTYLSTHQVVPMRKDHDVFSFIPVFESILQHQSSPFQKPIVQSFADALAGMVAAALVQSKGSGNLIGGQKHQTVIRFKQMVQTHYKELKQVQAYASQLHITPLYLNEIVKEITGFSASYWIHQEIMLEAKRLLYYTDLDVKQIAFELGYEDHAYFSRFFKKNAALTAVEFRNTKQ